MADNPEVEAAFLRELDIFTNHWLTVFRENGLNVGRLQGLMKGYAMGEIEDLPGKFMLQECYKCKKKPEDMDVYGDFEDSWIENGREFLKQRRSCDCIDSITWDVTFLLLPIEMEEIEED